MTGSTTTDNATTDNARRAVARYDVVVIGAGFAGLSPAAGYEGFVCS